MKEWRITNKVIKLMGFKSDKEQINRMQRDREISRIGNMLTHQVDILTEEYKRKIASMMHHILKDELK
jgi:hypothetical protein